MCSQYTQKFDDIQKAGIDKDFGLPREKNTRYSEYVYPHTKSVVIVSGAVVEMSYSLVPAWSKERKPKFATYNCRIETALEKPTWKDSFKRHHCIVPISSFIEPIYEGEYGGHMVGFSAGEVLYAAGIYNNWVNKETGEEIPTFAIVTKPPYEFVAKAHHDRSPLLLSVEAAKEWLANENADPEQLRQFLFDQTKQYEEFQVERLRKLKSS